MKRGWWLREALATEGGRKPAGPSAAALEIADVAIVGGGYTGMWAAWFLGERGPEARIVILEQDICGGGPGGRNGGFVHGWWEHLPYLVRRYGPEEDCDRARGGRGRGRHRRMVPAHGVDAWFRRPDTCASMPSRGANDWARPSARMAGVRRATRAVDRAEVQAMCASPVFGEGLFMPSAATVQPARLARGLRRVLLERGVRIREGTARADLMERQASGC